MRDLIFENYRFDALKEFGDNDLYHKPVLVRQVMDLFCPLSGKLLLDCTLGGGGHSERFLSAGADVIGVDQDLEALEYSKNRLGGLGGYGKHFTICEGNFSEIDGILDNIGVKEVDGAILDLGVSSRQLDDPARGFSFREIGPLDMRMSSKGNRTAADLLNSMSVEELTEIFFKYGEEPKARQVARSIEAYRKRKQFVTTADLLEAISATLPKRGAHHPATKIFMALRIAVNDELGVLERGLERISSRLSKGAVLAVISFHSLEDRIVKTFFRERSREWDDRPEWPVPRRNPKFLFKLITSRPIEADEEEVKSNPRARSAKLRAVARL